MLSLGFKAIFNLREVSVIALVLQLQGEEGRVDGEDFGRGAKFQHFTSLFYSLMAYYI